MLRLPGLPANCRGVGGWRTPCPWPPPRSTGPWRTPPGRWRSSRCGCGRRTTCGRWRGGRPARPGSARWRGRPGSSGRRSGARSCPACRGSRGGGRRTPSAPPPAGTRPGSPRRRTSTRRSPARAGCGRLRAGRGSTSTRASARPALPPCRIMAAHGERGSPNRSNHSACLSMIVRLVRATDSDSELRTTNWSGCSRTRMPRRSRGARTAERLADMPREHLDAQRLVAHREQLGRGPVELDALAAAEGQRPVQPAEVRPVQFFQRGPPPIRAGSERNRLRVMVRNRHSSEKVTQTSPSCGPSPVPRGVSRRERIATLIAGGRFDISRIVDRRGRGGDGGRRLSTNVKRET